MLMQNIIEEVMTWIQENFYPILVSIIIIIVAYIIYIFLKKQVKRLQRKDRIDKPTMKNILSLMRILLYIFILISLSIIFIETFGALAGVFTVAGGTIIGFAAMNTIGNFIAGLIIVISKPFEVGDRVMYDEKLADVIEIKLVFTVLKDIDGIIISIPNQELLRGKILNYGKNRILRREVFITAGYDVEPELIEEALLDATSQFQNILEFPEPRVDLFNFLDFAVKYRLLVYINNSKIIPKFNHDLRKAIYYSCQERKIDLSTPSLILRLNNNSKKQHLTNSQEENNEN